MPEENSIKSHISKAGIMKLDVNSPLKNEIFFCVEQSWIILFAKTIDTRRMQSYVTCT